MPQTRPASRENSPACGVSTVGAERLNGADQGGTRFTATLLGANEVNNQGVPNQGDPDGSGDEAHLVHFGSRP